MWVFITIVHFPSPIQLLRLPEIGWRQNSTTPPVTVRGVARRASSRSDSMRARKSRKDSRHIAGQNTLPGKNASSNAASSVAVVCQQWLVPRDSASWHVSTTFVSARVCGPIAVQPDRKQQFPPPRIRANTQGYQATQEPKRLSSYSHLYDEAFFSATS